MKRFEYRITHHLMDEFKQLVFLCTESGDCQPTTFPASEASAFVAALDLEGGHGWELVQIATGNNHNQWIAFWKREKDA